MIKLLASRTAVYFAVSVVAKGIAFALMVFYANILTAAEFGILGTFAAVLALVGVYIGFRPETYVFKVHAECGDEQVGVHLVALYKLLAISFAVVSVGLALGAGWLPIDHDERWLFASGVALTALVQGSLLITNTFLVSSDRPKAYATTELTMIFGFLIISLPFVYFTRDWTGRVLGDLLAISLAAAVSIVLVKRQFRQNQTRANWLHPIEPAAVKAALRFLFPVTFHVVGFAAVTMLDRLLIADMMDVEAVGRYTAAYSLGMVLGVAHDAALRAWNPQFFRLVNEGPAVQRKLWRIQWWYAAGALVSSVIYGVIATQAFDRLFPAEYHSARGIVLPFCLAYGFEGVRKIFCGYLYHRGRTSVLALITVLASVLNIFLNLWWIPIHGLMGAALATLIAFFLMALAVVALVYLEPHPTSRKENLRTEASK
jgi:O-antigen/teichoic acid export membrane protein